MPQADVVSTQKALAEVATTGRKPPPPVAGQKLPPVVAATSRHKLLLGMSSPQPAPQADDATTAKVSSEFLEFPDFLTFSIKPDVGQLMFRTKPLHLNLLATTTMRRRKRMMSTSMNSSTLAPAGMICSCLLWMKS